MGAHEFQTDEVGTDLSDAYARACEQAEYEYGHDPYNGTIATTSGVVDHTAMLAKFHPARRVKIAEAAMGAYRDDGYGHDPKYQQVLTALGWRWVMDKQIKPDEADAVARIARGIEKWGPCAAYELTGKAATGVKARAFYGRKVPRGTKAYRFFGMAAS